MHSCPPEDCTSFIDENKKSIKILHMNIRSINSNFSAFLSLLTLIKVECDIIVLSECWLSKVVNLPIIPGYILPFRTNHNSNQNDGVVIYVRENITYNVTEPEFDEGTCLICHIGQFTALVAIYRSPSYKNIDRFISSLNNVLQSLSGFRDIVITGDLNIDIKCDSLEPGKREELLNLTSLHGLLPTHLLPTRIDSPKCVDHLLLRSNRESVTLVLQFNLTDHFPVLLCLYEELGKDQMNQDSKYFIVFFLSNTFGNFNKVQCVPYSWITFLKGNDDVNVHVAYSTEEELDLDYVANNTDSEPSTSFALYKAIVLNQTNSIENAKELLAEFRSEATYDNSNKTKAKKHTQKETVNSEDQLPTSTQQHQTTDDKQENAKKHKLDETGNSEDPPTTSTQQHQTTDDKQYNAKKHKLNESVNSRDKPTTSKQQHETTDDKQENAKKHKLNESTYSLFTDSDSDTYSEDQLTTSKQQHTTTDDKPDNAKKHKPNETVNSRDKPTSTQQHQTTNDKQHKAKKHKINKTGHSEDQRTTSKQQHKTTDDKQDKAKKHKPNETVNSRDKPITSTQRQQSIDDKQHEASTSYSTPLLTGFQDATDSTNDNLASSKFNKNQQIILCDPTFINNTDEEQNKINFCSNKSNLTEILQELSHQISQVLHKIQGEFSTYNDRSIQLNQDESDVNELKLNKTITNKTLLRYTEAGPNLIELVHNSGLYIEKLRFEYMERHGKTKQSKLNELLEMIFTRESLRGMSVHHLNQQALFVLYFYMYHKHDIDVEETRNLINKFLLKERRKKS